MTEVTLHYGDSCSVRCRGHATGSLEVCAAISCLIFTAAGWLHNTQDAELVYEKLDSGDAYLRWHGGKWLYELLKIGFLQLQKTEPEKISVKFSEFPLKGEK